MDLKKLLPALNDVYAFLGLVALVTGASMVYPPAGWIVAGLTFLKLAGVY